MNGFGLGMLVGFLAFSDEGAKIIGKIAGGIKNAAQKGGEIIDRYEKLDSGQNISGSRQQTAGGDDVPLRCGDADELSGTEKTVKDTAEKAETGAGHSAENLPALPQRTWLPAKTSEQ